VVEITVLHLRVSYIIFPLKKINCQGRRFILFIKLTLFETAIFVFFGSFALTQIPILRLIDNNKLLSWGGNCYGQLGFGHKDDVTTPTEIEFFKDKKIRDVSLGYNFTLVLAENQVFACGLRIGRQYDVPMGRQCNIPIAIHFLITNLLKKFTLE